MSSSSGLSDEPADLSMFDYAEGTETAAPSKASDGPSILERLEEMELELQGDKQSSGTKGKQRLDDCINVGSAVQDEQDEQDAMKVQQQTPDATLPPPVDTSKKRKASASSRAAKAAATKKAKLLAQKYELPFVVEDAKSPLADADLRAILLHPKAWTILTPEEKKEILALFPDNTHIASYGTDEARPNVASLRNDNNFRYDCARYGESIGLGKHDPDWLREAWIAHIRRNRGDFDDHIVQQFENDWGIEIPEQFHPKLLREGSGQPVYAQNQEQGRSQAEPKQADRSQSCDRTESVVDPEAGAKGPAEAGGAAEDAGVVNSTEAAPMAT